MTTELHPIVNKANMLKLRNVRPHDADDVDAWLFAIDLTEAERREAIRMILSGEEFCISNIEHRVTLSCRM